MGGPISSKNGWFFKLEILTYSYGVSFLLMMKKSWEIQNQSCLVAAFHLYSVEIVLYCRPRFEFQISDFDEYISLKKLLTNIVIGLI